MSGAALPIEISLRVGYFARKAGARDPTLRQPSRPIDRRRCAGPDPNVDRFRRTQREACFCEPETVRRTNCLAG